MTAPDLAIPLADDDLPGLARVTAPASLAAWLSEVSGVELRVVPRRLRYKPGFSLVMALDVLPASAPAAVDDSEDDPATRHCLVRSYAPRAASKARKALSKAPPGSLLAYDAAAGLIVTTAAGDRALPLLARLEEPDGLRRVVGRALPDRPDLAGACIRTLRHNPERRWVGLLESGGGPAVLLRGYPADDVPDRARLYEVLQGGSPRTPARLGRSRSFGVVAVEWVAGHELASCAGHGAWRAGGAALAALHDRTERRLPRVSAWQAATEVRRAGDLLARLLPEDADGIIPLAREVAWEVRRLECEPAVVHGDFSADQVIVGGDGSTALVDLDRVHLGDPAADLGCAVAELMGRAEETEDVGTARERAESLVEGYATARRLPTSSAIATHALAFRLRKAVEPFRTCRPDWPARVRDRLERVEAARERRSRGDWS